MMPIIQIALIVIGGVAMGIMWTLQFHFEKSLFKNLNGFFWNPEISWLNKYEKENVPKPKFIGSTTVFVFLTDAFHLLQFIFINSVFLAMSLTTNITPHFYYDFLILRTALGIPFELTMKLTKTKKPK